MNREKSFFLAFDEATGLVSANPHLNQRFVKEEVFSEALMNKIGFSLEKGMLNSLHNEQEAHLILEDLSQKIRHKEITTRNNRGKVVEVLEPSSQRLIDQNKSGPPHSVKVNVKEPVDKQATLKQSRRTPKKETELFGDKLYLRAGEVSNLYRDILDLYQFYLKQKNMLSQTFPGLIRMSLRLLCETAADEDGKRLENYLRDHFGEAKERLTRDTKTTLSSQNISEGSIVQLLHIGAHNYQASKNMGQTLALSVVVGSILSITHGKG